MHANLEEASDLHLRDFDYIGNSRESWERFYDEYDRWSRNGLSDKDPLRVYWDSQNDRHRGVGSAWNKA